MTAVPQGALNWLYSVLIKDHYDPRQTYQDPNRTYYDVASALAQYPSLGPRTDVYTHETGFSSLLLQLTGTVPVSFRGTIYKFPITLWIPNTYPIDPPIVFVTPTQDMAVRVGQHVTLEGRVYHHYLAHWVDAWDRSSIVDLLSILREVFAKEPPVKYKQQIPPQPQPVQTPPPVPPLPPELGPSRTQTVSSPQSAAVPPPPPPKPGQMSTPEQLPPAGQPIPSPAVPPLPPKEQDLRRLSYQPQATGSPIYRTSHYPSDRSSSLEGTGPSRQSYQQPPAQQIPGYSQGPAYSRAGNGTAVSPISPQSYRSEERIAQPMAAHTAPAYHPQYQQPTQAPRPPLQHQFPQPHPPQPAPAPQPEPKPETPDLLTSPFEIDLPSFTPSGPPPPIPPNPEKDALQSAVSRALAETLQSNTTQSEHAANSLHSQSQSLHSSIAQLRTEIASLNSLNSTLQSNTDTLKQSLHRADGVIADAQSRTKAPASEANPTGLPPIDEVLVAPTVVGKQLYDLVAEEAGIQQAIYALQAALVRGVVGVEAWSRHTRGLAREAFLKRALVKKIGRGMGLEGT